MTSQKSESTSLSDTHVQSGKAGQTLSSEAQKSIHEFITVWNARQAFFSEAFIEKLNDGNRRALAELQKHSLSPTHMDLREQLGKCVKTNVPDDYVFSMGSGKTFSMDSLKRLVPSWASLATKALINSDPALADKLMTQVQWNAKAAFEVIFTTAMNELKNMKKTKQVSGTLGHYNKWILNPLKDAIANIKTVNTPRNSLIGYGNKISLAEAMEIAEGIEKQFEEILRKAFVKS